MINKKDFEKVVIKIPKKEEKKKKRLSYNIF